MTRKRALDFVAYVAIGLGVAGLTLLSAVYGIDEKWLDFLLGTLVVFGCVLAQLRIRLRNQTIRWALVGALPIHTISGLIFFAHFDRPKGIWLAVVDIVEIVAISTAIDRLASRSSN